MTVADQTGFRRDEVRKRYEQYVRDHHGELDIINLAETMYQAGERNAIEMMQSFVDIGPRLDGLEQRVAGIHRLLDAIWHRTDDDPSLPLPF